jgi:hypothetical protein
MMTLLLFLHMVDKHKNNTLVYNNIMECKSSQYFYLQSPPLTKL